MSLDKCTGVTTAATLTSDTQPGRAPPEWARGDSTSDIYNLILHCDRILVGDFVRGPASMVMEAHTNATAPDACEGGDFDFFVYLHAIWVSDSEIAAHLNATLKVPTRTVVTQVEQNVTGALSTTVLQWREVSSASSYISYTNDGVGSAQDFGSVRFSWLDRGRARILEFEYERDIPQLYSPVTSGHMVAPTLFAESGSSDYIGRVLADRGYTAAVRYKEYEDAACSEPS
jgi:hypothetical protein